MHARSSPLQRLPCLWLGPQSRVRPALDSFQKPVSTFWISLYPARITDMKGMQIMGVFRERNKTRLHVCWRPVIGTRCFALFALLLLLIAPTGPAKAEWRESIKKLTFGFLATAEKKQALERRARFQAYLSRELGIPIDLYAAPDLASLINAHASARVQYAVYPPSAYSVAQANCRCLEPLVMPKKRNGEIGYHAVLLVRAGSAIAKPADLEDRILAFTKKGSITGHLLPMALWNKQGLEMDRRLAEGRFAGSARNAARMLDRNQVDAMLTWSSLTGDPSEGYAFGGLRALVSGKHIDMRDIRIIWRSPSIPFAAHAISANLPGDFKRDLQAVLIDLGEKDPDALDSLTQGDFAGLIAAKPDSFSLASVLLPEQKQKEKTDATNQKPLKELPKEGFIGLPSPPPKPLPKTQ